MAGGHCGYVLQPSTMRDEAFDPFDKSSLRGLEPCAICIEVGVGSASSASWWEGAAPG
jgi:phosphatidylinositol phospholipase C gamma-1